MDQLLSPRPVGDSTRTTSQPPQHADQRVPEVAITEAPAATVTVRLTLSPEELVELTGYKRCTQQARWLKENGFKFRLDRRKRPRVDRHHYEARMGCKPTGDRPEGGSPNWAALFGE